MAPGETPEAQQFMVRHSRHRDVEQLKLIRRLRPPAVGSTAQVTWTLRAKHPKVAGDPFPPWVGTKPSGLASSLGKQHAPDWQLGNVGVELSLPRLVPKETQLATPIHEGFDALMKNAPPSLVVMDETG